MVNIVSTDGLASFGSKVFVMMTNLKFYLYEEIGICKFRAHGYFFTQPICR